MTSPSECEASYIQVKKKYIDSNKSILIIANYEKELPKSKRAKSELLRVHLKANNEILLFYVTFSIF